MKKIILLLLLQFSVVAFAQSGTLDPVFNSGAGADNYVYDTQTLGNGKILIGGNFATYNGVSRKGIALLNPDGSLDSSFNPGSGFDQYPLVIKVQNDGKILEGGYFSNYNGASRSCIVRLNADGSLDTSFNSGNGASGEVDDISIQADGKIVIGGGFTSFNGYPVNRIARLNIDGSLDTSFNTGTGANGVNISAISIQGDGKILIGGYFSTYNGTAVGNFARLNTDGSLDSSFKSGSGTDYDIRDIKIQNDGKIIIGGSFAVYNNIARWGIARLNNDGSLDGSFVYNLPYALNVYSCAVHENGKIVVGGYSLNNGNNIIQLNTDGSFDTNFNPSGTGATAGTIYSVKIQGDGKILSVGSFTAYNNVSKKYIARINGETVKAPPPLASAQTFCKSATVADLVATGNNLKWYNAITGGTALELTTMLATGTYYVSQTINNTESKRTAVFVVSNLNTPASATTQTFCNGATIANIAATGQSIQWYSSSADGSALPASTVLATGTYYASQTLNGCESTRTGVSVTVKEPIAAPTADAQLFCSNAKAIIADLKAAGTAVMWYLSPTGGTALNTSSVVATGTYYASQTINGCESVARAAVSITVLIVPAPTASTQSFCSAATVADLMATGTAIKWYSSATGTALPTTTPLTTGTLYASQTVNLCESSSKALVNITTNPTGLTVSGVITTSAILNWTPASIFDSSWDILLVPSTTTTLPNQLPSADPTNIPGHLSYSASTHPFTVPAGDLIPGTIYFYYVRTICPNNDKGSWGGPFTFNTSPSCPKPTSVSVSAITTTSATLGWKESGTATQWEVCVVPSGTAPPVNGTPVSGIAPFYTVTTNPFIVTGLESSKSYTFYVRSLCSATDMSTWTIATGLVSSSTAYSTDQLVKIVLVNNPCVVISNVTSSTGTNFGSVNGIGSFDGSKSEFPLASGIVLSSGNALSISGPNSSTLSEGSSAWTGDTDLEKIITAATGQTMLSHNASKLEFDFTSMNEFMSFNFLFASEEYGIFQCAYSDSFAFLLTDLTTNTTTNLAVVPGTTTPVSVITIRDTKFNSACPSANPAYFDRFFGTNGDDPSLAPINYNGISKLMTASSAIIANHPYHIKLVVADRSDTAFDTSVFIQGGSFTSGPPECMDKVKLVAFVDANTNGIKDSGESSFTYGSFVMQKNNIGSPTSISAPDGSYTLYESDPTNVYDFSFQINPDYAPYYSVKATNFNDINVPAGSGTNTLYFPVTVKQTYKNVSVTVIPMSDPVPGGTYTNKVMYKNSGTITASGTITFTKPDAASVTYISQPGTVQTVSGFTYDFTALAPGETRAFDVSLSIPDSVKIGDVLTSVASITANVSKSIFGGTVTSANSQTVVTSQASTAIAESHAEKIPFSTFTANDYLTYTIRFQNTGSANATSVRIEDVLSDKLDLQSLAMIDGSHNYVMERVGNKIVWKLDYINLVGAPQSDALSRGYLTFKIKMLPGFATGTIVPNEADIYFDGNDPVSTNTLNTVFTADQLSAPSFESQNILLFPNPASDNVQVRLQNSGEILDSIAIYDLLGKMVLKATRINADQSQINVGELAKGVYLVEITTQNQFKSTQKLIIK